MKKILLSTLIFFVMLVGCRKDAQLENEINNYAVQLDDYRNYTASINSQITIADTAKYSNVDIEACFSHKYMNVEEIAYAADNIVVGKIVDITYNDDNAIAKTFCSFAVSDVLKGEEIDANSIITVMEFQGYCRLSKFIEVYGDAHFPDYDEETADTSYFVYSVEGEPLVNIGDEYVLFLSRRLDANSENGEKINGMIGNYYITIATFMGRYKLNEEGLYERYSPYEGFYKENNFRMISEEEPMSLEEIKTSVSEVTEQY